MDREELIVTVTKITQLRSEIAKLSGLQKELKGLEAIVDEVTGVIPAAPPTRTRRTPSIEDRIYQLLASASHKDWSAEDVAQHLGVKIPTTRAAFSKLRKAKRIVDTRRGHVQVKADKSPFELDETTEEERHFAIKAA